LKDEAPEVRSAAVLELGGFARTEDLAALAAAAHDENMLVSVNAVYALAMYTDPRAIPYLAEVARTGGLVGTQALGRLAQRGAPEAVDAARVLVKSKDAPDRLAAIKVLGELGSKRDLVVLREIEEKEGGELSSKGRGFGLMPTVSLSRAAKTAIQLIEQRGS
jgi:HEAT repeat protein